MGLPFILWINPTDPLSGVGIAHHPDRFHTIVPL